MFRRKHTEITHKLDLLYTALVVRDPGTSTAAEAYEGLRKQVIAASTSRQAHAVQLAELDVALRRGATLRDLERLSDQWLRQAGIVTVTDPDMRPCFEPSNLPLGDAEVELPAYVIDATSQVVRQGRLRRRTAEQVATLPPHVEDDLTPSDTVESALQHGAGSEDSTPGSDDSSVNVVEDSGEDGPVEEEGEPGDLDKQAQGSIDDGNSEEKS